MKKLTIIITALALVLGMAQCRKTENPTAKGVFVTVKASIGDEAKTDIAESGIIRTVNWSQGDKLYVVGATQGYLGTLTISEEYTTPSATASFEGVIDEITSQQDIHFYYFGKTDVTLSGNTYTYSISTQNGTLDGIENNLHLMHGTVNATAGQVAFRSISMKNMMAIGLFNINGYATTAKCNAIASRTLNLMTGEWSGDGTTGDITLNNPSASYYMVLIPSTGWQTMNFSTTSGSNQVQLKRKIEAGRLYTDNGDAILVKP